MGEIEVNEYVRTKDGHIAKYIKKLAKDEDVADAMLFDSYIYEKYKHIRYSFLKEIIVNHSKQLIDLVEVGDIVNDYKVLAIEDSIYENSKRILIYKNEKEKYERWIYIQEYNGRIKTQDDIVIVLTKEQYEANCYKVGGKE